MQIRFGVNKRLQHGTEHKVRSLSDVILLQHSQSASCPIKNALLELISIKMALQAIC